jgi:ABC-type cobalamin/Fe3+-siderophores transport system ATPase subunit
MADETADEPRLARAEFRFPVDTAAGPQYFHLKSGDSMYFVGANGTGKSRLAVAIESNLPHRGHRISAHRVLALNPGVPKIREEDARHILRYGYSSPGVNDPGVNLQYKWAHRWSITNQSTHLLNDFDVLLQVLFAEQTNTALASHNRLRQGPQQSAVATLFERLKTVWENLIPHRNLVITGDDIKVAVPGTDSIYQAFALSDGERAIFYLLGQALCAEANSVLIIDEPELHMHRAIMAKLWDAIESERKDCAFVYITHDLEFVASRNGQKFTITSYKNKSGETWIFEPVPEDENFGEELIALILGSRRPILFIEGNISSLDISIFRNYYKQFTVIPKGSCGDVIHSVVSMRNNAALTRVHCTGIIDRDGRTPDRVEYLRELGIEVLPVSEIENVFLLPEVVRAIAMAENMEEPEISQRIHSLTAAVAAQILHSDNLERAVGRYVKRQIDDKLKIIDLGKTEIPARIEESFAQNVSALNIPLIASERREALLTATRDLNFANMLALYDNKGLFHLLTRHIKGGTVEDLKAWLLRSLRSSSEKELVAALSTVLPNPNVR